MARRGIAVVTAGLSLAAAACFDGGVPADATLYCSTDADCPSALACDVDAHLCAPRGDDARGPAATRVSFEPAVASTGTVTLAIEADDTVAGAAITFVSPAADPGFVLASPSGQPRAELIVDASEVLEGFYPLASVSLTGEDGKTSTTAIDAVLKIDRTPPQLDRLQVLGDLDGVHADAGAHAALSVSMLVSEALDTDAVAARIDDLLLPPCAFAADAFVLTCAVTIPPGGGGAREGNTTLVVTATDPAGNTATAQADVTLDLAAPLVVPGSVSLSVDGDESAPFASVGSKLTLRMLVDEPLAGAPAVVLDGGEGHAFTVAPGSSGNLWTLSLTIDVVAPAAPELRTMTARLVDRFGHERLTAVPLPSPFSNGLRVLSLPESPCTIPPRDDGSTCTDFDADGFLGPSAACAPALVDCDDRDPAIYPGAIEIPGDGVANDCGGGADAPLVGVFVDADNGDDTAAGTAAAPVATLARALELATTSSDLVVLAAGQTFELPFDNVDPSIVGGRDPTTWERIPGATSAIVHPEGCETPLFIDGAAVIEGLELGVELIVEDAVVRDVVSDCTIQARGRALLVDVDIFRLGLFNDGSGTRFLGHNAPARLQQTAVQGVDLVFHRVLFEESFELGDSGEAVVTSSVIRGSAAKAAVACNACDSLAIYHSNIVGDRSTKGVDVVGTGARVVLVGNIVRLVDAEALLSFSAPVTTVFANNVVDLTDAPLLLIDSNGTRRDITADATGFGGFEACDWQGCSWASGSVIADVTLLADNMTLDESAGPSDARERVEDATQGGAPTFVVGDVLGQCRELVVATAGAKEQ